MVKKEYMKPALLLTETEVENSILVTSLQVVKTSGLDSEDDLQYDDFEDNFILAAAERAKVDFLVTSDQSLLRKATVAALSPQDMLAVLKASTK